MQAEVERYAGAKTTSTQAFGRYHVIFRECIICAKLRNEFVLSENLSRFKSIFGMEVLWDDRHQPHTSLLW